THRAVVRDDDAVDPRALRRTEQHAEVLRILQRVDDEHERGVRERVEMQQELVELDAGASEHLLIADVANLRQAIDALKEKGIWVVAADESGDLLYDEVDYRGPTAVVIGGEGEGIRRLVLEGADQAVRLPMEGMVSSLNASAAGTVLLYEALRQRRHNVPPAQTRTPRPVVVAEEIPNGEREAAEAEEGGPDETDQ